MFLEKQHHIAIICSDYAKTKAFYIDKLGFRLLREVYRPAQKDYLLMLRLGDTTLEVFEKPNALPSGPPSRRPWGCGIWPSRWRTWPRQPVG